ncbi:MAG: cyclic nucleotide-binding domain-containing protein [Chloroflexota bacterium]
MADPKFNGQAIESTSEFLFGLDMFAGIPKLPTKRGSDLSPAAEFLKICQEYKFERGAVIAHKLDVAEGMYIFRSGTVDAWEVSFNNEHQEQEFKWKSSFTKDDILGDVWLFEPGQHHRLLRARKGGSFILIKKSDFLKFISRNKKVLKMMYPHMSDRAKEEIYLSGLASYLRSSNGAFGGQSRADRAELVKEDGTLVKNLPAPVQSIQLLPDELIFYHSQRSWKILIFYLAFRGAITISVLIGIYLLLFLTGFTLTQALLFAVGAAILPALWTLLYWIDWRNAFFLVTSNQLIRSEKRLLQFNSELEKIDIGKVQSIAIEKNSLLHNWFNVGTAQITTAAQDSVVYFDNIDQPEEVEAAIVEVQSTHSSIAMGKRRAEMRAVIHKHFGVQDGVKKVDGFKPTPREKTMRQKMQEVFVRSETKDSITYHKHPIALFRLLIWPMLASVVLIFIWYVVNFFDVGGEAASPTINAVLVFLSIGILFWAIWTFADWQNDTFQVTNQYIYDIDRLPLGLSESRKQAELNRIENVRTEKDGILPTLFNFGAVHVETAGAENNIVFENVKDPDAVQAAIFKKRQEYENELVKRGNAGSLDMMTTLIEMYDEANAQRRIHQFRELPDPQDDYGDDF